MAEFLIIQVAVLGAVITSGLMGIYWIKTRTLSPKYMKQRVNDLDDLVKQQRKETSKWRSKWYQQQQTPQVEHEGNLETIDDAGALIKDVLPEIKGMVPKEWKKYLDNPKLVELAIGLYKQNPKIGNQVLQRFIKKKGGKPESNVDGVPEFKSDTAI